MRALRAERVQLIARLQHQHPLPAHRDDDKLFLLQLGRFIARQMRWSRWPGLLQRFEITNNWVCNADHPTEKTRAQDQIEKMTARDCRRSRIARHTAVDHEQFRPMALRISSENSVMPDSSRTADFYVAEKIGSSICSGSETCSGPRSR